MKNYFRRLCGRELYQQSIRRARITLFRVVVREIRCAFPQFFTWRYPFRSLLRVFGVIASALIRLFLGRSVKYTYAHGGEDRILMEMIKLIPENTGFYVDVGANHPVYISNTYGFYRMGWRGICIDANEKLIAKYKLFRPRDRAIQSLVSDSAGERTFYLVENDVLSSTEPENLGYVREMSHGVKEVRMKPQMLTDILRKNGAPFVFDLLTVDAEEHDYHVLRSLDFTLYRPRIIVLEDETFEIGQEQDNRICAYLATCGYSLSGSVLKNLYFKDTATQ